MPPLYRRVVQREPGPGSITGIGDIVTDCLGNRYRIIDEGEASIIRSSTAGTVYTIHSDGTIR